MRTQQVISLLQRSLDLVNWHGIERMGRRKRYWMRKECNQIRRQEPCNRMRKFWIIDWHTSQKLFKDSLQSSVQLGTKTFLERQCVFSRIVGAWCSLPFDFCHASAQLLLTHSSDLIDVSRSTCFTTNDIYVKAMFSQIHIYENILKLRERQTQINVWGDCDTEAFHADRLLDCNARTITLTLSPTRAWHHQPNQASLWSILQCMKETGFDQVHPTYQFEANWTSTVTLFKRCFHVLAWPNIWVVLLSSLCEKHDNSPGVSRCSRKNIAFD
jgi:hypothetical protein